jgi:uncharacterized protein (DUF2141 family)
MRSNDFLPATLAVTATALLAAAVCATVLPSAARAADLTVEVDGIESADGQVQVGLFNGAAEFPGKPTTGQRMKVDGTKVTITFKDLPAGRYAVSAYHDENDNNKLDRGMFGIPKERYGFSQDARGVGGPPEFRDAAFELPADGARITVRVR